MTGPTPIEVSDSKITDVGGLQIHRALPRHGRRMVGAWCFLDRFGPLPASSTERMAVGPHPHIGLHTVTWLLKGEARHTDSLGNDQMIRPGQLNLMTAGGAIAHAEDSRQAATGEMDGVQLWVAQPESTRHGSASFVHLEQLPTVSIAKSEATVLIGAFAGTASPAPMDSPLVGVDLLAEGSAVLPLDSTFEYALFVVEGTVTADGVTVQTNQLAYFAPGREGISLESDSARLLLLGGLPFGYEVMMWWNFVARSRDELEHAYRDWNNRHERFGEVSSTLTRIEAPRPFWMS
jgi:quercetin 2,3-dioxygenase